MNRATTDNQSWIESMQNIDRTGGLAPYTDEMLVWKIRARARASAIIRRALKRGILVRAEKCTLCKKTCTTIGHTNNPYNPLEVVWVCRSCYMKLYWAERKAHFLINTEGR